MANIYNSMVAVAILFAVAARHVAAQDESLCVLTLQIATQQSPWTGKGDITVPFPATITNPPLKAVGKIYVSVPTTSGCPPDELTAADAAAFMERASLILPIEDDSISFRPSDIKGNVSVVDAEPGSTTGITFDFNQLELGFTGNEPFGKGAVKVGTGAAAEAKAVAQPLCSQLVLLGGKLNLTSVLGPRTANVRHVAFNRSMNVGVSLKKEGDSISNMVLYMGNASMLLDISPEKVPGVELTRGRYLLSGDIVATADLSDINSWEEVDTDEADWSRVQRIDNPVILGGKVAYPRVYGVNATTPAACTAKRALDASGALTAASPSTAEGTASQSTAAGEPARSAARMVGSCAWLFAAGLVASVLTLL